MIYRRSLFKMIAALVAAPSATSKKFVVLKARSVGCTMAPIRLVEDIPFPFKPIDEELREAMRAIQ